MVSLVIDAPFWIARVEYASDLLSSRPMSVRLLEHLHDDVDDQRASVRLAVELTEVGQHLGKHVFVKSFLAV